MIPKPFEEINASDIFLLVQNQISEHKSLDYKETLSVNGSEERAELLYDISSFANASGGDLVFGISDQRDQNGKPTGLPAAATGLQFDNPAAECERIENLARTGIDPKIPVLSVKSIELGEGRYAIIVRVGKSWIAPHMVTLQGRSKFYSRNGTGKVPLDVHQIGAAFALQRGLGERLRSWRAGRVAKAISGDGPIHLRGPQILFHCIPADTLMNEQPSFPRPFDVRRLSQICRPISLSFESSRYNADGLLMYSKILEDERGSYLQIFRDGGLEFGDTYFLASGQERIGSKLLEQKLVSSFTGALNILRALEATEPLFVTVTLTAVKQMVMALPNPDSRDSNISHPFDRDVISSPDVQVTDLKEGEPYPSTLLPIVNAIWQAAGMRHSPYMRDGQWNPSWRSVDRLEL